MGGSGGPIREVWGGAVVPGVACGHALFLGGAPLGVQAPPHIANTAGIFSAVQPVRCTEERLPVKGTGSFLVEALLGDRGVCATHKQKRGNFLKKWRRV